MDAEPLGRLTQHHSAGQHPLQLFAGSALLLYASSRAVGKQVFNIDHSLLCTLLRCVFVGVNIVMNIPLSLSFCAQCVVGRNNMETSLLIFLCAMYGRQ